VICCENMENCGFFKKHQVAKNLVVRGFINKYCQSELRDTCKRKEYKMTYGLPPPDDMLPNGLMMK
jgi:hypothetical protein